MYWTYRSPDVQQPLSAPAGAVALLNRRATSALVWFKGAASTALHRYDNFDGSIG